MGNKQSCHKCNSNKGECYDKERNITFDTCNEFQTYKKQLYEHRPKPISDNMTKYHPISNDRGLLVYNEKIMVLKNNEWAYDTYLKSNKTIDKKAIAKYINQIEKGKFEIDSIKYEFHGGVQMGINHENYKEIEGSNIWIVKMKPNLYSYLESQGLVGDTENIYLQQGGSITIDSVNHLYQIDNNQYNKKFNLKNVDDHHINFDEVQKNYYTYLNIYKDGKFLEKKRITSLKKPITWDIIAKNIEILNNEHYGYIFKLTNTWNEGITLETSSDIRYKINYL